MAVRASRGEVAAKGLQGLCSGGRCGTAGANAREEGERGRGKADWQEKRRRRAVKQPRKTHAHPCMQAAGMRA